MTGREHEAVAVRPLQIGGIAPRLVPLLESGEFVQAFRAKGRLAPFLERIPVRVILETRTALIGAAWRAASEPAVRRKERR